MELRANDLAAAETLGPGGKERSDIDIRFEDEDPSGPMGPAVNAPRPSVPQADTPPRPAAEDSDDDEELRRFLEGLG